MNSSQTYLNKIVLIALILMPQTASAGWRVLTDSFKTSEVLFSARDLKDSIVPESGYYFPVYFPDDSVVTSGFHLFGSTNLPVEIRADLSPGATFYAWTHSFESPVKCTMQESILFQRMYVEQVTRYSVYIHSKIDNGWYKKSYSIPFERYQIPKIDAIGTLTRIGGERTRNSSSSVFEYNQVNEIDEITIVVFPRSEKFEFVVGDLKIANWKQSKIEYNHPLFDPIVKKKTSRLVPRDIFSISDNLPVVTAPLYMRSTDKSAGTNFYIVPDYDQKTEPKSIRMLKEDIISRILSLYPFYDSHNVDKSQVLDRFAEIRKLPLGQNEAFEDSIRQLVSDFNDVHFDIVTRPMSSPRVKVSPLALYEIENDIYIAAVFDTLLTDLVGNRIVSIDNVPIQEAILKESRIHKGSGTVRRRKALNTILKREKHERVTIRVQTESETIKNVTIRYDRKILIPPGFVPAHGEFRILENNIVYFRVARWTPDVWIRFLNHSEQIQNSKGIVLDLRSNGGGDVRVVIRLVSTFIDQPVVAGHLVTPADGRTESMIVYPHPVFHFNQPMMILANNRTACASEEFIDTMRYAGKAHMLSNTKTQGTDSALIYITLPDGYQIATNTWMIRLKASGESVEASGIAPDYWVHIDNVDDLAHRDDKLLKVATTVLGKNSFSPYQERQVKSRQDHQ